MSTEQDLRGIGNRMMEDHHLNDCPKGRLMLIAADELAAKDAQIAALRSAHDEIEQVLLRKGFTRCDISACNCGSWHHRYGLPERWQEIQDALAEAGVLDNSTGNMPIKAVEKLVGQRESLTAEVARLRAALLSCARKAESLKRPCGLDPEGPQAIRNGQYQNISTTAHIALGTIQGAEAQP